MTSTISIKQKKTKFCINCKHFINDSISGNTKFGKCTLFVNHNRHFLINGKHNSYDYRYSTTVRGSESLCGEEGKHYKKKYKKRITNKKDEQIFSNMIREIHDDENNYYE